MFRSLAIFCLALLIPKELTREVSLYALWNVGQGQWFSWIKTHECIHIDVGGDRLEFSKISAHCTSKKNKVLLTHLDWDHIGGLKKLRHSLGGSHFCVVLPEGPKTFSPKKLEFIKSLPTCAEAHTENIKSIEAPEIKLSSNDSGTVYMVNNEVLIPGDQSSENEHFWLLQLSNYILKGVVVPHHGSKNSSGQQLFRKLKLEWAWISARKKRYGHPHEQTLQRYRNHGIPVMTTEDWGHLLTPASH